MNQNGTNWTPSPEDNLLQLSDKASINEYEAKGIAIAELFIFGLNITDAISANIILEVHRIAFGELYEWAGKWRVTSIIVGRLEPPEPYRVPMLMYQFIDNLNHKILIAYTKEEHIECLLYAHYEFIRIHPFNNGNGRTGRMLMNLVAMKLGYKPLVLYYRTGDSRMHYIQAMQAADEGDYTLLSGLISTELEAF